MKEDGWDPQHMHVTRKRRTPEETNDVQHVVRKLGFAGVIVDHKWVSANIMIRH